MRGRLTIFLTVALVVVLLVVLNAASYVRVEDEADLEYQPDRSTGNAGATGTRALFDFLQQSGHSVARWTRPPASLFDLRGEGPATFVVVGQLRTPFEDAEAEALLQWVADGGRLVVIDRTPDSSLLPPAGPLSLTTEVSDYPEADTRPDDTRRMTDRVPALAPAQPTVLTRDVERVQPSRYAAMLRAYPSSEEDSTPTRTPAPGATPPSSGEKTDAGSLPVAHVKDWRGATGALLVDYAYGRGRVVVLSDPFIVSNAGVALADNLQLAVNVVVGEGGLVVFDEYHQGLGAIGRTGALALLSGTPFLWMFAQGAVITLAVLWTRGRRFARPLPAAEEDRRSKLEFVASMAELQQRARAHALAIENIYARTRRALARYAGVPATVSSREIAARVAARSGKSREMIERLMRECEDAIAGAPVNARQTLALIARLRELERDLGIRMRARELRQERERQK